MRLAAIRTDRDYCICLPKDRMLYVEVPTGDHLVNLLLTGKFRGQAHFRTSQGYTPYSGGGVAFPFKALLMRGVKPIWYPNGDHDTAVAQLIEDGVYADEREAQRHSYQSGYAGECEWIGPGGMRFNPGQAVYAWYNPRRPPSDESLVAIREALPGLDLRTKAPESGSSPCKAAHRVARRFLAARPRFEVERSAGQVWVGLATKTEDVGYITLSTMGGHRLRDECDSAVEALRAEVGGDPTLYRVMDVEVEPQWRGKGWGMKLYERALKAAAPAILVTGACTGMGTTAEALRIWAKLAKRYPSKGSGDALVIAVT